MSAIVHSLTILSEEQKFNGDNLLQWKNNITQLLGAKGLMGYIDGKIPKPSQSPTSDNDTPTTGTPIYSMTPTLDEWNFRDQLTRAHITLNCTDVASLGVIITGTAKDAWDSIANEWGKSTDMRRSHAQEALNRTEYTEGNDIQDHIKLLRTRKAAVDNLSTSAMSDEAWRGIIIRSIPPTPKWLPVIPSLYSMTTAADIVSTLLAHGMILGRGFTTNSTSTALATHTNISEGCKNPDCKAKDRSTHKTEDCYWPGGGKEGQFPANFGQRHTKANITVTSDSPSQHFVLSARILETPGQSGILFDDSEPNASSVGEQIPTPLDIPTAFERNCHNPISTTIDCTQDTETDTIIITDTPINDQLASANQPGTTDIPVKLQRSDQTLQPRPTSNSSIIEYASNPSTITDTKPDKPSVLNTLIVTEADYPTINSTHHVPVHQIDQRNIAVITANSIIRVKNTKTDSEYHGVSQSYRHSTGTDCSNIFSIPSTASGNDKEITSGGRGNASEFREAIRTWEILKDMGEMWCVDYLTHTDSDEHSQALQIAHWTRSRIGQQHVSPLPDTVTYHLFLTPTTPHLQCLPFIFDTHHFDALVLQVNAQHRLRNSLTHMPLITTVTIILNLNILF